MLDRARRRTAARYLAGAALITCVGCRSRQPPAALPEPEPVAPEPVFVEPPEIPKPPPACTTRTPAGSPGLIPEGVPWIIHVSPRELLQSKLWSIYGPLLEPELGLTKMREALSQCGSSLEAVDGALLGVTGDYDTQVVTILTGQGSGRVELIECVLQHQQSESESTPGLRVGSMAGAPEVPVLEFGDERVYLFHDDLAVLATDPLAAEVEARSRCAGVSAVDHGFAELLARTDTRAPLWLVSLLPRELAAQFEGFVGSAIQLAALSPAGFARAVAPDDDIQDLGPKDQHGLQVPAEVAPPLAKLLRWSFVWLDVVHPAIRRQTSSSDARYRFQSFVKDVFGTLDGR